MPTQTHNDTAVFPLLANPEGYRVCQWDLASDHAFRPYWIDLFRGHFSSLLEHAGEVIAADGGQADPPITKARSNFIAYLGRIAADPTAFGPLNVFEICKIRENILRDAGIADPYRLVKLKENERALAMLPALLSELDAMPDPERHVALIKGVFAGNIFDMGAAETVKLFAEGTVDFSSVRAKLKPRPWRFDALDDWLLRMAQQPYRGAVMFVDNAGPDVLLGMIPLARELLRQGTAVILSANSEPSLNDVTHNELTGLVDEVARLDTRISDALATDQLRLIASGNWAPLMDLTRISPELAQAASELPVDLVVLEGMGRAIESNYDAAFTCDVLRLAMIKDAGVAEAIGAKSFDLLMRFRQAR